MYNNSQDLTEKLAALGLPLFVPTRQADFNEVLADVVKSHDLRLWETFPALLAVGAEKNNLSLDSVRLLLSDLEQGHLHKLLILSVAVFTCNHLSFPWIKRIKSEFSAKDNVLLKDWKGLLLHGHTLGWEDIELDTERLNNAFHLYFNQHAENEKRKIGRQNEFALSYALSQIFPPKQMEIFKKKSEGYPLSKTEQEYYSRVIRKKVVALANIELHSMARRLLAR